MFCSQCGNKLPDNAKFCARCGQRAMRAPVPEPVFEAPVPEPVFETPIPEPVFEAPVPEPVFEAPMPEPVFEAPVPEPAVEAPIPEPVFEAPVPEPAVEAPIPEPVFEAPVPEPAVEAPIPEPVFEAPVPEPAVEAPIPEPAVEEPFIKDTKPESLFSHPTFGTMKTPEPVREESAPAAPGFVPVAPVYEEPIPQESAYGVPMYGNAGFEKRAQEPEPIPYRRTAYEPAYEEPVDQPAFLPEKEPEIPQENRALSPWAYFGYSLLFSIPVIGWIFLIVFSFAPKNVNLKNFTRSYWLWAIVLLAIALIALILIMTGVLKGPIEAGITWLKDVGLKWVGEHLAQ